MLNFQASEKNCDFSIYFELQPLDNQAKPTRFENQNRKSVKNPINLNDLTKFPKVKVPNLERDLKYLLLYKLQDRAGKTLISKNETVQTRDDSSKL